jgi:hypothetical protein
MATRIPASQRTREELRSLIEGRLSTGSAKDELVKLATRLIVEEALEGEASDTIGREYYEHGAQPGQGYRNGHRTGRLKTAEGLMEYSAPQIAGRDKPFHSAIREHLKGHTQGSRIWRSRCWHVLAGVTEATGRAERRRGRPLPGGNPKSQEPRRVDHGLWCRIARLGSGSPQDCRHRQSADGDPG